MEGILRRKVDGGMKLLGGVKKVWKPFWFRLENHLLSMYELDEITGRPIEDVVNESIIVVPAGIRVKKEKADKKDLEQGMQYIFTVKKAGNDVEPSVNGDVEEQSVASTTARSVASRSIMGRSLMGGSLLGLSRSNSKRIEDVSKEPWTLCAEDNQTMNGRMNPSFMTQDHCTLNTKYRHYAFNNNSLAGRDQKRSRDL